MRISDKSFLVQIQKRDSEMVHPLQNVAGEACCSVWEEVFLMLAVPCPRGKLGSAGLLHGRLPTQALEGNFWF